MSETTKPKINRGFEDSGLVSKRSEGGRMDRVKAIATGVIFDGAVDCYVLDDGRRVVSQRGVLRALTVGSGAKGDGRRSGDLGVYLARLAKENNSLATAAIFEFARPDGGVANGIESSTFVDILNAYVDAAVDGKLTKQQAHLARNAATLLKALQKVGLDALIDEATGRLKHVADGAYARRLAEYIRENKGPHRLTFKDKLVRAFGRLYGLPYDGGPHPRWMASVNAKLYRVVLGREVASEIKTRNPLPSKGSNHHQYLTESAYELTRDDLEIAWALAKTADVALRLLDAARPPLRPQLDRVDLRRLLYSGEGLNRGEEQMPKRSVKRTSDTIPAPPPEMDDGGIHDIPTPRRVVPARPSRRPALQGWDTVPDWTPPVHEDGGDHA